jgi:hypothetical protein
MFISIASIMGIIAPMPPPTACPHPSPPFFNVVGSVPKMGMN